MHSRSYLVCRVNCPYFTTHVSSGSFVKVHRGSYLSFPLSAVPLQSLPAAESQNTTPCLQTARLHNTTVCPRYLEPNIVFTRNGRGPGADLHRKLPLSPRKAVAQSLQILVVFNSRGGGGGGGGGGTHNILGWGCAARNWKPFPYFRPKYTIFHTLF